MPSYDQALKDLLQKEGTSLFDRLGGAPMKEMLNVELPMTRAPRADLVSWLDNGRLFHLEFQSFNDSSMAWRMLEYYSLLTQRYGKPPLQAVLYVGNEASRMDAGLNLENLQYSYRVVDIRGISSEDLLASQHVGDHVLAILCDRPEANPRIRRIIERLAGLPADQRLRALQLLLILSILRGLGGEVQRQVENMGLEIDILSDPYFRAKFERRAEEARVKGLEEGRAEGLEEGLEEGRANGLAEGLTKGRADGEISVLQKQLERRFGTLPSWAEERLASAQESELERWALEVLTAKSLDEVFI